MNDIQPYNFEKEMSFLDILMFDNLKKLGFYFETPFNLLNNNSNNNNNNNNREVGGDEKSCLNKFIIKNSKAYVVSESLEKYYKHIHTSFYNLEAEEIIKYICRVYDVPADTFISPVSSTIPICMPINSQSVMTVYLVSHLIVANMNNYETDNSSNEFCLVSEIFNHELITSKCETHFFGETINLIGLQKVIFNFEYVNKLSTKKCYMLVKSMFLNNYKGLINNNINVNKYSIPRIFVHNNTTKCITEVICGDTQMNVRIEQSPPSLVPAAVIKQNGYLFFIVNHHVHTQETFNLQMLALLTDKFQAQISSSLKPFTNKFKSCLPKRTFLVIIPLTKNLDLDFLFNHHFRWRKNELDQKTIWMLITKKRRLFFKRKSKVVCYLQTMKRIQLAHKLVDVGEFFRGKTITVDLVDRSTNWLGALFFARPTNNKLKVPHTTVFYPHRNHFLPWQLDNFNFVSHFFQTGLKRDEVEIWLQGEDLRNDTDALMFDSILYNLNCLVHVIDDKKEQTFGYDYDFPTGFLNIFANFTCCFHDSTQINNSYQAGRCKKIDFFLNDSIIKPNDNFVALVENNFLFQGFYFSTVIHLFDRVLDESVINTENNFNGFYYLLLKLSSIKNEEILREAIAYFNTCCLKKQKEQMKNKLNDVLKEKLEYFMAKLITLNNNNNNNNNNILIQRYHCINNISCRLNRCRFSIDKDLNSWFYKQGVCAYRLRSSEHQPVLFPHHKHDKLIFKRLSNDGAVLISALTHRNDLFIYLKKANGTNNYYFILPSFSWIQVLEILQYMDMSDNNLTPIKSIPEPLSVARKIMKCMNLFISMRYFLSYSCVFNRDEVLMKLCTDLLYNISDPGHSDIGTLKINSMIVYLIQTFYDYSQYEEWKRFKLLFFHNNENETGQINKKQIDYKNNYYFISKVITLFELLSLNNETGVLHKGIYNKLLKINIQKFVHLWLQQIIATDDTNTLANEHWNILQDFVISLFTVRLANVDVPRIRINKQRKIFRRVKKRINRNKALFIIHKHEIKYFLDLIDVFNNTIVSNIPFVEKLEMFIKYCGHINIKEEEYIIVEFYKSSLIHITREINNYILPV